MKKLINNFVLVLLIFLFISGIFTLFSDSFEKKSEIPLSQLVLDINQEKVKEIIVSGLGLEITYKDGSKALSKKEAESTLSESLINYGARAALNFFSSPRPFRPDFLVNV